MYNVVIIGMAKQRVDKIQYLEIPLVYATQHIVVKSSHHKLQLIVDLDTKYTVVDTGLVLPNIPIILNSNCNFYNFNS